MMIQKFKLTQLYKLGKTNIGGSVEHVPEEKVDCKIEMLRESKTGLWNYCQEHSWSGDKIATVRFDGYCGDGVTPINPDITQFHKSKITHYRTNWSLEYTGYETIVIFENFSVNKERVHCIETSNIDKFNLSFPTEQTFQFFSDYGKFLFTEENMVRNPTVKGYYDKLRTYYIDKLITEKTDEIFLNNYVGDFFHLINLVLTKDEIDKKCESPKLKKILTNYEII